MNNKIAFLTTIFPTDEEFINSFFTSLDEQTYTSFDIYVVNDGYKHFEDLKIRFPNLNIFEINYSSTPLKNREYGINFVINLNYSYLIFGDIDDYFESNRIQVSLDKLEKYDVVVNDLVIFNKEKILDSNYFSNRLPNNYEIDLNFLISKNICGLSNTAIKIKELKPFKFDKELIALDWYFFTYLLLHNYNIVFTNETRTYYRQYESNTIGIGKLTEEKIDKIISVKVKHYQLLKESSNILLESYNRIKNIESSNKLREKFQKTNVKFPFWWEELELKDKYEN